MKNPFIYKRKNGFYYLAYQWNNKRISVSTNSKNKSEANKFFLKFKSEAEFRSDITMKEFFDIIMNYTKINFSPKTNKIYQAALNNLFKYTRKNKLRDIQVSDIEYFKIKRIELVRPNTVNIDLSTLKSAFNIMIRLGYIFKNPAYSTKLIKIPQKERRNFSKEELTKLLSVIEEKEFKDFVLFSYYTGCRLSEIMNIEWNDFDFELNVLKIRNKENFTTKSGKNRYIPISDNFKDLILDIKNNGSYLFTFRNKKYYKQYVQKKFSDYRDKADISKTLTFHCLRHTFITNLINANVNINYVKELAGHSKIETTLRYIHIQTENLRNAVNCIEKI